MRTLQRSQYSKQSNKEYKDKNAIIDKMVKESVFKKARKKEHKKKNNNTAIKKRGLMKTRIVIQSVLFENPIEHRKLRKTGCQRWDKGG